VLPLLAGCSGFWDPPTTSTTATTTTTLSSGYFFVLTETQIVPYSIVSGVLTQGTPVTVGSLPSAIAVAPNHSFLYVSTISGIYVYTISSGALTLASTSPIVTDDPTAMAVDSTNSWLVEGFGVDGAGTGPGAFYINAVPILSTTGLVNASAANCAPAGQTATVVCSASFAAAANTAKLNQIAIAPKSDFVFAALGTTGTAAFNFSANVSASSPNPIGSVYTPEMPVASDGGSLSVAVDPSSRLLYVGESQAVSGAGGLRAFTFSAGTNGNGPTLSEQASLPYASGGSAPNAILPKATGDVVYVANGKGLGSGNVTAFSIAKNGDVYSLTNLGHTVTIGVAPIAIIEDSLQHFVMVENNGGGPNLDVYYFDTTTSTTLDLTTYNSAFTGIAMAAD
jgi:6-phosphogluconolactonase (cycloisomerase 2 family)